MVLPVQRFSPAPGIYLDRTNKHVDISGWMEMWGPEATMVRAASVQHSINNTWSQSFADGYSCKCAISVRLRPSGASQAAQIEALKMAGPSNVRTSSARPMQLNANEHHAFTWVAAHEFGHVLGLSDRYSESVVSQIRGAMGGRRENEVHVGYEGNLMAEDKGILGGKNIADLAGENQPGYMDDDDQIRLWVLAHTRGQISALADKDKLTMILTLMDGWFSDDDLKAVKEICAAVATQRGAEIIRNGVDLTDLNNHNQRAAVQAAFNAMPR